MHTQNVYCALSISETIVKFVTSLIIGGPVLFVSIMSITAETKLYHDNVIQCYRFEGVDCRN